MSGPDQIDAWCRWQRLRILAFLGFLIGFFGVAEAARSAEGGVTESQVKALCIFNFAKYVSWPPEVFLETNSPFVIAILGQSRLAADLKSAVTGKVLNGHPVLVCEPQNEGELGKCHILFISASGKGRVDEILGKIKTSPILTVGETEQFASAGGAINFIKKENKVRFEVDLNAARLSGLQISSKLLSLADVVRGKPQ